MRRALPVLAIAGVAFLVGAAVGAHRGASAAESLASRYVSAWTRGRLRDDVLRRRRRDAALAHAGAVRSGEQRGAGDGDRDHARASRATRARRAAGASPCRCGCTRGCSACSRCRSRSMWSRTAAKARGWRGRARSPSRGCSPARRSAGAPRCRSAPRCSRVTAASSRKGPPGRRGGRPGQRTVAQLAPRRSGELRSSAASARSPPRGARRSTRRACPATRSSA